MSNLQTKEEENIPVELPNCYNQSSCHCYHNIQHSQPETNTNNYFLKTLNWLKQYLHQVTLHINKNLLMEKIFEEEVNLNTIQCSYQHFLINIDIILQWCTNCNISNGFIKTSNQHFPLELYLNLYRNILISYLNMYQLCFNNDKKFPLLYFYESLSLHVEFLKKFHEII